MRIVHRGQNRWIKPSIWLSIGCEIDFEQANILRIGRGSTQKAMRLNYVDFASPASHEITCTCKYSSISLSQLKICLILKKLHVLLK